MADDFDERVDAIQRAELAAFASSWALLGIAAIVHLWPPVYPRAAAPGGTWWRCACGTPRRRLRRALRSAWRVVLGGLVWLGLHGAPVTPDLARDVRRWHENEVGVAAPCCPYELVAGTEPAA